MKNPRLCRGVPIRQARIRPERRAEIMLLSPIEMSAHFLSILGAGRGLQYSCYHQVSVLAHDRAEPKGHLCLYQLWGSGLSQRDRSKVDPAKLDALIFDQFQHGYYVSGEKVGEAWNAGAGLMKE